ncbi:MAG: flagellar FlbD family protein [Acidobacteriaceae bacterium]|jgi:flagellar protein FlbD|nr:flagellar FlbD family protein [Acidobacteriaceae bacterium]
MIALTRINGSPLVLNSDLIEQIESMPDTIIRLTNGHRVVVRETPDDIIDRVVAFQRRVKRTTDAETVGNGE